MQKKACAITALLGPLAQGHAVSAAYATSGTPTVTCSHPLAGASPLAICVMLYITCCGSVCCSTGTYAGHSGSILQLLVLGNQLLSLGKDKQLCVWNIGQYDKPQAVIGLGPEFDPTCMVHPDTYINKVVTAGQDGSLQLWNFVTGQLIHTFKGW
eukprot:GHUV01058830.1.p1 GENE.GHUV01058830.1~~GHUV01058830.1.p1  ORF type:complete len:155 (+),score=26.99 GHUV01058830.1:463-927(+)